MKTSRGATRPRQDENETRRDGLVYKRGARPSRRPSGHAALFSHRFSDLFFDRLFLDFGFHFASILEHLSCFLHPFFEHRICIVFLQISGTPDHVKKNERDTLRKKKEEEITGSENS